MYVCVKERETIIVHRYRLCIALRVVELSNGKKETIKFERDFGQVIRLSSKISHCGTYVHKMEKAK